MNEATKMRERWEREGLWSKWIKPPILDIGCGNDKITPEADGFDLSDGDAQTLDSIPNAKYTTVFSSHCIEHMRDPHEAMRNWWRVLRPGGLLVVIGPDEDLYEQCVWPSVFNADHKNTLTLSKDMSWSPRSINLTDLMRRLPHHKLLRMVIVDTGYDYSPHPSTQVRDQTLGNAEANVEMVVLKQQAVPAVMTQLGQLVMCPRCGRGNVVLVGRTTPTELLLRCYDCGVGGRIG